jgi:hypothetical protein
MIDLLIIRIPFQQPNKCSYAGIADPHLRVFNNCWKLAPVLQNRLIYIEFSTAVGNSQAIKSAAAYVAGRCGPSRYFLNLFVFLSKRKKKIKSGIFGTLKLRIPPNEHSFPFAGDQAPDRARHFALASCCIYTDRAPGTGLSGCSSHARFLRLLLYRVVQISHSSRIRLLVPSPAG